jgi:hypothetical protein
MANAPLIEAGRGELVVVICPTTKAENFLQEDWTIFICVKRVPGDLPVGQISRGVERPVKG